LCLYLVTLLEFTSCFHKWKRWIILTILITKQGLLVRYTTRKLCFLTTNYGHNEFAELQIGKFIFWPQKFFWPRKFIFWGSSRPLFCWATWKICFLTTTHGHLPSPSYKAFFPGNAGFSYSLSKASRSKYMQLCRNHTHFESIHECVHALVM